MIKIMLVEDDKSLREIYGVRLLAEGYDIVSAGDGEEALAVAIKERPALIVTDVMMPKISGFDMLDILRSTTETKNIKVIVMTALGSDEQRQRGNQLGADRYLVKSQVGIEDVVRTVHEVLGDKPAPSPAATAPPVPPPSSNAPTPSRSASPALPTPLSVPAPQPQPRLMTAPPTLQQPAAPTAPPHPPAPATPSIRNRVIQPINDPQAAKVDINELLDRELAKEAGLDMDNRPAIASTQQEKALVQNQISQFTPQTTSTIPPTPPVTQEPTIRIDSDGRIISTAAPATSATAPALPTQPVPVATATPIPPPTQTPPPSSPPLPPPPVR